MLLQHKSCKAIGSSLGAPSLHRWLEHDPQELLSTVRTCIQKALQATEDEHGQLVVKAVGLTNQRETTIVWDRKSRKALYNAIVWPDSRNAAICSRIQKEVGAAVRPICAKMDLLLNL